jgi:hypothetical protein
MYLFLAALLIPIVVGLYIYQREPGGILSGEEVSSAKRLNAALLRADDWSGALCGAPVVLSLAAGLCVFAFRLLLRALDASGTPITLQRFAGLAY